MGISRICLLDNNNLASSDSSFSWVLTSHELMTHVMSLGVQSNLKLLVVETSDGSKPTFSGRYSTHSETADAEMDLDIVDTDTDRLDSSASE